MQGEKCNNKWQQELDLIIKIMGEFKIILFVGLMRSTDSSNLGFRILKSNYLQKNKSKTQNNSQE